MPIPVPEPRMGRGAFVAGTAALLSSAIAGGAADAGASGARRHRVAIVGAGLAGLTAARVLLDHGVVPMVFEAQRRAGGRVRSEAAFFADGQVAEYGGELIDSGHATVRALAARYGLAIVDLRAAQAADAVQTVREHDRYVSDPALFAAFRRVFPILAAQVAACGPETTYARSTAQGRALDTMSLKAWIDRFVPGAARSDLGGFLLAQYTAEYGVDPDRQSALNLVLMLGAQPNYDARTGKFAVYGTSDERYHIAGGNERLVAALQKDVPRDALRFGHRMAALAQRSDGRVELTFDAGGRTRIEVVDAALVALPFSVLRDVDLRRAGFDARKRAAIDELAYGDHAKLVAQFDERFWRERGPWAGRNNGTVVTDGRIQATWDASRGQPGRSGLLSDFRWLGGGAASLPPMPYTTSLTPATAAYASAFVDALDAALPGASRHANGLRAIVARPAGDRFTRGSYAVWRTGQYARFAGYERVRQGNVHFAGEHCSVSYQGFMEGAAQEGARAARAMLRDLTVRCCA